VYSRQCRSFGSSRFELEVHSQSDGTDLAINRRAVLYAWMARAMMRGFGKQESYRNQRGRNEPKVLPADRLEHCTAEYAGAGESDVCRGIVEGQQQ
jgi:hypothetical protein